MGSFVHIPLRGVSVLDAGSSLYLGPDAPVPTVRAFRATPAAGQSARPGTLAPPVLLVHGAWGLDRAICDVADALAAVGSVVLVPDLAGGRRPSSPDAAAALLAGLDPDDAIHALAASLDALRADPDASSDRGAAAARARAVDRVDVAGFGGGAPLAAFLAVVRPEVARLVLAGGDPPDLPVANWEDLEADVLVLRGADQDGGPAAGWAATLEGLGRRVSFETLADGVVADDPAEPEVRERIVAFLRRPGGG